MKTGVDKTTAVIEGTEVEVTVSTWRAGGVKRGIVVITRVSDGFCLNTWHFNGFAPTAEKALRTSAYELGYTLRRLKQESV